MNGLPIVCVWLYEEKRLIWFVVVSQPLDYINLLSLSTLHPLSFPLLPSLQLMWQCSHQMVCGYYLAGPCTTSRSTSWDVSSISTTTSQHSCSVSCLEVCMCGHYKGISHTECILSQSLTYVVFMVLKWWYSAVNYNGILYMCVYITLCHVHLWTIYVFTETRILYCDWESLRSVFLFHNISTVYHWTHTYLQMEHKHCMWLCTK